MLVHTTKYIALPAAVLVGSIGIGQVAGEIIPADPEVGLKLVLSWANYGSPFVWLALGYVLWNAYHFAMQNFGVLSIYRMKGGSGKRKSDKWFCLAAMSVILYLPFSSHLPITPPLTVLRWATVAFAAGSAIVMLPRERHVGRTVFIAGLAAAPAMTVWWGPVLGAIDRGLMSFGVVGAAGGHALYYWPFMWSFVLITVNHWTAAIGIAAHTSGRPIVFATLAMMIGIIVFVGLFISVPTGTIMVTVSALSCRIGLGFVHFLYDRWVYKFSDPQVRATIGRNIFFEATM
jgi:hypothetical protein